MIQLSFARAAVLMWIVCIGFVTGTHDALSNSASTVTSVPKGFLNIPNSPIYEYGPTVSLIGDVYVAMWCSPGLGGTDWDVIRMSISRDLISWLPANVVLQPQNAYDLNSVCDPSLVTFRGEWLLYHTCINTQSPPDGYKNNRICVSIADSVLGPYHSVTLPVLQDLACSPTDTAVYCVGQPSAVVEPGGGAILLYFTKVTANDTNPPNKGYTYVARSTDGIHFEPLNGGNPIYGQRDVDVKYDRYTRQFLMVQGDVGSTVISYATSRDGINFTAYDPSARTIATNSQLPTNSPSNNNPGLVGMPDGSFGGMTQVIYGSSIASGGWAQWQLFRSDAVLDPSASDCSSCVENSCDFGCRQANGTTAGQCAVPGSTNAADCCDCVPYSLQVGCGACAPGGCVAACRAASYQAGICAVPGSTNSSDCCACLS
jgi:hypothetical protein